MHLSPARLAVEGIVERLLGPLLSLDRRSATGWRLLSWSADAGVSLVLAKGDRTVLIEIEARDDARACFARTARFNVCARAVHQDDASLGEEERRVVNQVVALLEQRGRQLPVLERPEASPRVEVREVQVTRVLIAEGDRDYSVNPYTGCLIGCSFCYVAHRADFSRSLEALPSLPWGATST